MAPAFDPAKGDRPGKRRLPASVLRQLWKDARLPQCPPRRAGYRASGASLHKLIKYYLTSEICSDPLTGIAEIANCVKV
jgi:hypothetical protein